MKKPAFFFTFVLLSISVFSQNQSIADSLYTVIQKIDEDDTSRLRLLVWITQNENVPEKRREIAEELLKSAEEVNNKKYMHHAYIQIGQVHRIQGNFDSAIEDLMKARQYSEEANYHRGIIASTTALADAYSLLGNYDAAIEYYRKSILEMNEADSSLLAVTLLNLGDTYYMTKQFDSALYHFESSKLIYEQIGNSPSGIAYNLGNIGLVQAELGKMQEAESNIALSIEALEELGDHYGSCIFLGYMSDIYLNNGYKDEARTFADSCMRIGTRFGLKTEIRDNLLRLSNIAEQQNDYVSAYRYHKRYLNLKDSISNDEVFSRIKGLESAYELSQKQAEVDLLKAQRKNQQSVIVTATVVVFAFAILVIVIFVYYRSKIKINRVLKRQTVSLERLNETKDKFFSIISHDLRGPVSSLFGVSQLIRHFVKAKNTDQLLDMADHMETSVERLSNLLDNLLNWALQQQGHFPNVPEKVNVTEMIDEILEMFSNMASGKLLEMTSSISQPIYLWVDRNSVHTIFRNLINNSIKFTDKEGYVEVSASMDKASAIISIKDNGVGIPSDKLASLFKLNEKSSTYGTAGEKGLGLGLQLVQEFVEMNNGRMEVESNGEKGTVFSLTLPLFENQTIEVDSKVHV
ncbi:tetratricopeptide repeat-containing sensor histidine kinase [Ekhidna sp.]